MTLRRTVAAAARVEGFGLFTDAPSAVEIHPAPGATGLTWRSGLHRGSVSLETLTHRPVHPAFAHMPPRCTGIDLTPSASVHTIEHLLSAIAGLGITDALLVFEGPEVPIGDGSAQAFTDAIERAGIVERDAIEPNSPPQLSHPIVVGDPGGTRVEIRPAESLSMHFHLDYGPDAPIRPQTVEWDGSAASYRSQIAPARTYCLLHEARAMQALGLFARLSPADFLVIGADGPIDNRLRFPDEPARHKLLDLIGDLALAGLPWPGMRVDAFGSGHTLHHEAARALRSALLGRDTV